MYVAHSTHQGHSGIQNHHSVQNHQNHQNHQQQNQHNAPPPPPPPQHDHHQSIPPHLPLNRQPSSSSLSNPSNAVMQPPTMTQDPPSKSVRVGDRIYSLEVKQQPIRARMCGFGDKDRRPITPPPCVRLVIRDARTLKEVDINEVDTTFYVLSVDLWSADASKEVNLVHHSATSPSISAATSSSYPPPAPTPPPPQAASPYGGYGNHAQIMPNAYGHSPQQQHPQHPGAHGGYGPPQGGYYSQQSRPMNPYPSISHATSSVSQPPPPPQQQPQTGGNGMFTRNLIGSLSASAFKLTDPDNKIGVWFILQDLSVRTEGSFRLKMNFVNVGDGQGVNTKASPILATAFSDVFQVYSAKKFPGVIESTPLSKCFAVQGIKIPIRRDRADDNAV